MRISFFILKIFLFLLTQNLYVSSHEIKKLNNYQIKSKINFLHEYQTINLDGHFNAVIEITAGTNEKWEVSKNGSILELELRNGVPRVIDYLSYPFNYGFIPKTRLSKQIGGDGDAIDVIILSQQKLKKGLVVPVKIIGMLLMKDKGKIDNKIISVLINSKFEKLNSIKQLETQYPGILEIIDIWFANYKGTKIVTSGFANKKKALEFLNDGQKFYEKNK